MPAGSDEEIDPRDLAKDRIATSDEGGDDSVRAALGILLDGIALHPRS